MSAHLFSLCYSETHYSKLRLLNLFTGSNPLSREPRCPGGGVSEPLRRGRKGRKVLVLCLDLWRRNGEEDLTFFNLYLFVFVIVFYLLLLFILSLYYWYYYYLYYLCYFHFYYLCYYYVYCLYYYYIIIIYIIIYIYLVSLSILYYLYYHYLYDHLYLFSTIIYIILFILSLFSFIYLFFRQCRNYFTSSRKQLVSHSFRRAAIKVMFPRHVPDTRYTR